MEEIHKQHVTPDLPARAKIEIKEWRSKGPYHRTFHRVLEQFSNARCKNCSDAGFILVSFTRAGPFSSVPSHGRKETITWYDGDEHCGAGWYVIVRTESYTCHHCENASPKEEKVTVDPQGVQQELESVMQGKSEEAWWHE